MPEPDAVNNLTQCLERQVREAAIRVQTAWRGFAARQRLAALRVAVIRGQAIVRGKLQRARFLRVRAPACAARAGRHRNARQYMLGVLLPCTWHQVHRP